MGGALAREAVAESVDRPLSVLHLVAPAEVGGLESVLRLLAAATRARGHAVHVAAMVEGDGDARGLCDALREADVGVHRLVHPARGYRAERAAVGALCRALRPDVVHSHGYRTDIVDAGAARSLGIPTATTAHGFAGGDWRNRLNEWVQRRAMRRFDAVIGVSRPLVAGLVASGIPAARVHLVPNAHDGGQPMDREAARARLGVAPGMLLAGWVGRLTHEKGGDVLVDAVATLDDLPLHVAVVGDGRDRPALEERARDRGAHARITWHGRLPEASRLFGAFDLFVLSSRTEGTPMVLFEAMAAGVPIVATAVGGVPDVVSAREAVLVPPDDPAALGRAIRAVVGDPAAARARAAAARLRLEREFGLEAWIARHEALYAGLRPHGAGRRA